jgi:hypothetical protein
MANFGYKGGDVADFRDFLIKNLVVVEHAAGDDAERERLNDAAHDGTGWMVNDQSFVNALIAAAQVIDWLVERAAEGRPAPRADVLRELALASAQMAEVERENPSGGE